MSRARVELSAEQFMQEARAATGIDIVDAPIVEPLHRLLKSLNTEANLNERGAHAMQQRVRRLLHNRLRMTRDCAANPQIADQPIHTPLFLTGGPRTGSTKLQKLLAAGGDFKFLRFWQGHCLSLRTGNRDEDPGVRIREAGEYVAWIAKYAPQAQLNHGYETFEPEEESLILEHFICSCFPNVFANLPSFMEWWSIQDFTEQAHFLKRGLQYIQWQFHEGDPRPWLLKCPIYPGLEDVLDKVFPGAIFVSTVRNPLSTVASTASLVQGYRESYSDADYRRSLGATFLNGLAASTRQHLALRERRPSLRILDVGYADLTKRSDSVLAAVYAHAGLILSDASRRAMNAWEDTHRGGAASAPSYALADFGLTRDEINHEYRQYIDRFALLF